MLIRDRHLLGKKSWNVYNPAAIARVRRDEAEARTRQAENEKHLRDNEAEDRLARLRRTRGDAGNLNDHSPHLHETPRRKRKLPGEDDTDREIRLARQSQSQSHLASDDASVALFNRDGHIDLVQDKPNSSQVGDKSQVRKPGPDELGVKLIDATGRQPGSAKPWYSSTTSDGGYAQQTVSKDVWGNEDAGRIQRDMRRIDASDPLAAIKRGVKQLREAETRREEWKSQRERGLNEVEELARKERKLRRRRRDEEESLDGFNLDGGYKKHQQCDGSRQTENRPRYRHKHHHRSRRRTRSRSPPRH